MNRRTWLSGLVFVCAALACNAGDMSENYSVIWKRNVFSTVTPPPAAEFTPVRTVSPTQVKLTGIAVFPPQKWVSLEIQEPGKLTTTIIVEEGGRTEKIEVLRADPVIGQVWIRNEGVEFALAFGNVNKRRTVAEDLHVPIPAMPPPDAGER